MSPSARVGVCSVEGEVAGQTVFHGWDLMSWVAPVILMVDDLFSVVRGIVIEKVG